MSSSPGKIVPEINLDEFEKRLRAAGAPSAGSEDPLAELTRLVNSVHADARRAARAPQSRAAAGGRRAGDDAPAGLRRGLASRLRRDRDNDYAAEAPPAQEPAFAERGAAATARAVGVSR